MPSNQPPHRQTVLGVHRFPPDQPCLFTTGFSANELALGSEYHEQRVKQGWRVMDNKSFLQIPEDNEDDVRVLAVVADVSVAAWQVGYTSTLHLTLLTCR